MVNNIATFFLIHKKIKCCYIIHHTLGLASISFWSRSDRLLYTAISVDQKQDWSWSWTYLAKQGITYATACHASLCRTAWVSDVTASAQRLLLLYKHATGSGRWELWSQLQQQLVLWVFVKCCAGCY